MLVFLELPLEEDSQTGFENCHQGGKNCNEKFSPGNHFKKR